LGSVVAIVRHEQKGNSLGRAIELCAGFEKLKESHKVLIKPNLVMPLAPGETGDGVITRLELVKDLIELLREYGCSDITVGEGPPEMQNVLGFGSEMVMETTGYGRLADELGVKVVNFNRGKFRRVTWQGEGFEIAEPCYEADFLINVPVLKTHRQSVISMGLKNLKGCLKNMSKRHFHRYGLHKHIAFLGTQIKTDLVVIDGIYAVQRGPVGKDIRRLDLIIAGKDIFSCDMAGSAVLGIDPKIVPHFQEYSQLTGRKISLEDIEIKGEKIEDVATRLEWEQSWSDMPGDYGLKGITFQDPGADVCTACGMTVWFGMRNFFKENKGAAFENVEFCVGPGPKAKEESKKVILFGECAINANKDRPDAVQLKGCPPGADQTYQILREHMVKL